jgi:PAS domain S-box-containing protein
MTLRMKLILACGMALLIMGCVSLLSFRWTLQADEDQHWVTHTRTVLGKLDGVIIEILSAETEQRIYLLTGDRIHLTAYNEALNSLRSDVHDIRELTADNPRQQQTVNQFEPLISKKNSGLQEQITARVAKATQSSLQVANADIQSQETQEIRSLITAMKAEEESLLTERLQAAQASSRRMKIVIVLGNLLAILFFAASALVIYREMGKLGKTEEFLRQSEERFRLMTAKVKEYAIFMLDPEGRIASWNEGAERIKGYRADEIMGQHFSRFYPAEDLARGKPSYELKMAAEQGQFEDEGWRVRKDGTRFWANVVITALRDEKGILRGFAKVSRDMTERRRAEDETKRQNALLAAANKELDAFSYSVAHDLRAPLRAIDGFSQALLQDYQERIPEEGRLYLERVRAGAIRMGQLIEDLLTLARISRHEIARTEVDLSRVAEEVASQLRASEEGRAVQFLITPGIVVTGDRRLLRIALENLIGNAWKFTSKQPTAQIEFGMQNGDGERVLFVRDNGPGFDMQYADKLFGVFQRLHRASEFPGTGVGLATVQRVIHRHGGRIWADAAVGKGATFYFALWGEGWREG